MLPCQFYLPLFSEIILQIYLFIYSFLFKDSRTLFKLWVKMFAREIGKKIAERGSEQCQLFSDAGNYLNSGDWWHIFLQHTISQILSQVFGIGIVSCYIIKFLFQIIFNIKGEKWRLKKHSFTLSQKTVSLKVTTNKIF